jgi:hypothetical protein
MIRQWKVNKMNVLTMETIHEWNEKIILLIEELKKCHPELIGFLDEMRITLPDNRDPQINIENLKEYYNALLNLQNIN